MKTALLVGLGGVFGALARYYLGLAIATRFPTPFPWATLVINLSGCFALGLIGMLAIERTDWISPELRLLLGVGFCGAYTTFSTFGFETLTLLRAGDYGLAIAYVLASNAIGLVAVALGIQLARALA